MKKLLLLTITLLSTTAAVQELNADQQPSNDIYRYTQGWEPEPIELRRPQPERGQMPSREPRGQRPPMPIQNQEDHQQIMSYLSTINEKIDAIIEHLRIAPLEMTSMQQSPVMEESTMMHRK